MTANSAYVMVVEDGRRRRLVNPIAVGERTFLTSVRSVLLGKFCNAEMIDSALTRSSVQQLEVVGVPGPRQMGTSLLSYVLLFTLGLLTLSIPVRVRLRLENEQSMSLDEIKAYVVTVLRESDGNAPELLGLLARVERAGSVREIARVISDYQN